MVKIVGSNPSDEGSNPSPSADTFIKPSRGVSE